MSLFSMYFLLVNKWTHSFDFKRLRMLRNVVNSTTGNKGRFILPLVLEGKVLLSSSVIVIVYSGQYPSECRSLLCLDVIGGSIFRNILYRWEDRTDRTDTL